MSETDPIAPDSPLGHALSGSSVPELPRDFADRVIARTRDRAAPLPEMPQRGGGGGGGVRRWRSARRLGVAVAVSGALATAAAATGLLGDLPVKLPSADQVWSAVTGQEPEPVAIPQPSLPADTVKSIPALTPRADDPAVFDGPIDTPEELEEAFRRVDQVRARRKDIRRETVDRRINREIARRRAQGLPVPTPEQEERLRGRINRFQQRIENQVDERLEGRREEMRERVESGDGFNREEFLREQRPHPQNKAQQQRLEELRNLPPAERRARLREWREQRRSRQQQRLDREIEKEIRSGETPPAETIPPESDQ